MRILTFVSLLPLCLAGCATKETVYWEHAKHNKIIVHHVRQTKKGLADRTEELTAKSFTPAWIHTYDLGRMTDASGNVHEAHRYYMVSQSSAPNLMLPPATKLHPTGPKSVYTPPNYSPMPKDQRITDAVAEAHQAKEQLDEARNKVDQQLANDNNLKGALQDEMDQNAQLKQQLDAAMSSKSNTPPSAPAPATQPGTDALATWGQGLHQ